MHADKPARAARRWIMDIAYGPDPRQQVDYYPAPDPQPNRLVVYLHGGGWVTGNRRGGRQLAGPMNEAGYSLVSVGYRLHPQTDLAGCIGDAAGAIGYILDHAHDLQIERNGFVIMGHSAGAHMAALLATDPSHLLATGVDPRCIGTIVALDGIFDVAAFLKESARPVLRTIFGDVPAMWQRYSPIAHVGAMTANPKFCLMYEDANPRFVHQAQLFETELNRHHRNVVSAAAPGLQHAELILLFKSREHPMRRFVMGHLAGEPDGSPHRG